MSDFAERKREEVVADLTDRWGAGAGWQWARFTVVFSINTPKKMAAKLTISLASVPAKQKQPLLLSL